MHFYCKKMDSLKDTHENKHKQAKKAKSLLGKIELTEFYQK